MYTSSVLVTLILAGVFCGAVFGDPALCKRWSQQSQSARCSNSKYSSWCPQMHKSECGPQKDGNKPTESNGGGGSSGPQAEGCSKPDQKGVCENWSERNIDSFCSKPMAKKHCCTLQKKKCGTETPPPTPSGGGGGGEQEPRPTNPPRTRPPTTPKPEKKDSAQENYRKCCKENGVPFNCLQICTYSPIGNELCNRADNCESYFKQANYCGNNGKDHTSCCQGKGVPAICEKFCQADSGLINVADLNQLAIHRDCLENGQKPRDCSSGDYMENGKGWKKTSFPSQGLFPELVKNIVATLPICTTNPVVPGGKA